MEAIKLGDWPTLVMDDAGELRPALAGELPNASEDRVLKAMRSGRLYELEAELDFEEAARGGGFADGKTRR